MILFNAGIGALIVYVTVGRRRVDYRFVLAGAIAPDLVDGGLCTIALECQGTGRAVGHSLVAVLAVGAAVIAGIRDRERRVSRFGLSVGWLTHLVTDGMWEAPRTFLWPAFGLAFASTPAEPYLAGALTDPGAHLWAWAGELAGLAALAWFVVAFRLRERGRLRAFLKDGYLRP